MLTCPQDVNISAADSCNAIGNWSMPTASDAAVGSVNVNCTHQALVSEFGLGPTEVTCEATDSEGNTGSCSFYVNLVGTIYIYTTKVTKFDIYLFPIIM